MCMTRWGVWSLRPVRLFYVVIHAYIITYSEPIRNCIRNFLANVLLCAHKKTRTLNKVLVNDFGLIITCDYLNIPQLYHSLKSREREKALLCRNTENAEKYRFPGIFLLSFPYFRY